MKCHSATEIAMGLQDWFESLRKWIDGEEDLDEQGQPRPRSKWEDFLVAIAREVERRMQEEMFTPPGGPTYIPREYIVFLSPADDAEWQGEKREGLERGLHYVLSQRAKELVGNTEFQTRTLSVELRVDGALEAGRFRVQPIWDTQTQKTIVRPRKREEAVGETQRDDEATIVRPRKSEPVFSVSVRRLSSELETAPSDFRHFFKDEITIGRGSRNIEVDLRLEGDLEISRKHATITKRSQEGYLIVCHGANPILINHEREITTGESAVIKPGDKIIICSYELIIK
jgi:hypothetical protein